MKKISLLLSILLFILLGCTSNTINKPAGIPLEELPSHYPPEMAEKNGDYVELFRKTLNASAMDTFLKRVGNEEEAFIRVVRYTTEGDPIIYDFYCRTA
jgi:hypothetical protein